MTSVRQLSVVGEKTRMERVAVYTGSEEGDRKVGCEERSRMEWGVE